MTENEAPKGPPITAEIGDPYILITFEPGTTKIKTLQIKCQDNGQATTGLVALQGAVLNIIMPTLGPTPPGIVVPTSGIIKP